MLQVAFFYAPWVWEVYSADIIADEDWNEEMVSRLPNSTQEPRLPSAAFPAAAFTSRSGTSV